MAAIAIDTVQVIVRDPVLCSPKHSAAAVERSGVSSSNHPATGTTQFRPLDSGIVSEAIPAFFIGRNKDGFWVARDVKGQVGGIFLLENSALSFARRRSQPTGCATIFPSERIELDLENSGNPLVPYLGSLMRLAKRGWLRMCRASGQAPR